MDDLQERLLCRDGNCIGTLNERGYCNVCGKSLDGKHNPLRVEQEVDGKSRSTLTQFQLECERLLNERLAQVGSSWFSRYRAKRRFIKERRHHFRNNAWMFERILDEAALLKWVINNSPDGSILSITGIVSGYAKLRRFKAQKRLVWSTTTRDSISVEINSISRLGIADIVPEAYGSSSSISISFEESDLFNSYDGLDPACTYLSDTVPADQIRQLTDDCVVQGAYRGHPRDRR